MLAQIDHARIQSGVLSIRFVVGRPEPFEGINLIVALVEY